MFSLQRVVFDEAAERLVAALAASRPGKKEKKTKTNFLCLTVKTNESFLHRVRVTTDESYTKKKTWPLQALTAIDNVAPDSRQFILTFDRSYEWIAPNVTEKQRFLEAIVKSCRRYNKTLPQLANFQSIPGGGITVALHEHMPSAVPDENQQSDDDPYQESAAATLSKQQQEEMAAVFEKYDWATTDVRALSESLQKELQAVESANVHAMISSEVQVTRLLGRVDDALSKLDRLEQCISDYDGIVKPLRRDAQRVSDQMRMINVQQDNFVSLGEYTRQLTDFLTFSKSHVNALTHPDFNTAPGLRLTVEAANRLYSLLHTGLKPGWELMAVVAPHVKHLRSLQLSFSEQLVRHIAARIESATHVRDGPEKAAAVKQDHQQRRSLLKPLAPLMKWLSQVEAAEDFSRYETLAKTYAAGLSPIYNAEIQAMVTSFKAKMTASAKDKSQDPRKAFHEGFRATMGEIVPLVLEEQQLCEEFFHLHIQDESKRSGGGDGSGESDKGGDGGGEGGGDDGGGDDEVREKQQQHQHLEVQTPLRTPRRATTHTPRPRSNLSGSYTSLSGYRDSPLLERKQPSRLSTVSHQPQIHPLLHDLLNVMFNGLDDAIHTMMQAGYKQDAFNSTVALVVLSGLSQQVASESTFLFQLFGKCYVYAKRLYDSYIDSVVDAVMTAQVKKKDGCGILPFVSSFSRLVRDSEAVGAKEECHSLLDKAYLRLLGAIFDRVQEIAADAKEPDVILFENFHNLYDQLSRLKIDSLKQYRADAQEKYRTHITRFVQSVLGRPMERLSSFFEGVEQLIRQGTAPQDVGYYSEFNKQQLRAIIKLYPGKEVKKGLESTYKRVQKQLCTEENLLVVVWRSIQEEFVRLHAHFEELIAKCYPNSNIRLEFEVEDLLQYFASIAERS